MNLKEKLLVCLNVLIHDWRFIPPSFSTWKCKHANSDQTKAQQLFKELDEISQETARLFLKKEYLLPEEGEDIRFFFFNWHRFFPRNASKQHKTLNAKLDALMSELNIPVCDASSLIYHHGLAMLPESVLKHLADKDFVDAGACWGESTWAMAKYAPRKVYAFEPSQNNRKRFLETMKRESIFDNCYQLVPFGLDDHEGIVHFKDTGTPSNELGGEGDEECKLVTLDDYSREHNLNIGFIKADLEGMGLNLVKGAKNVIVSQRPMLTIAIYHSPDEFFGVYETLRSWVSNYAFFIRALCLPMEMAEIALIAIPKEWLPAGNFVLPAGHCMFRC